MASILLVDGEKGGVGKSWVARTLIQYFLDKNIPFYAVETDRSNPSVSNVYSDCKFAIFSENEQKADLADMIFDLAIERPTIVSLPAQVHRPLTEWIDSKGLVELGKEHGVTFKKLFVTDGESDSIGCFLNSLEHFKGTIPHVLVKNDGRCDDWEFFNEHQELQKSIKKYKVQVIDFPKLATGVRIKINSKRLSFGDARKHDELGIIGKSTVKQYLDKAYKAFEAGEILK